LARAAAEEIERAVGQCLGGDHVFHHGMRQERGRGGGLGEDGYASQERNRSFFPQAPTREIERVDVHGDAAARHHQVNGLIILRLGESHGLFIEQRTRITEPRAETRIVFERADAAIDVDRRVRFRVAGIGDGDRFIPCAVCGEHVGDGADELGSLGVAQATQAALAFSAREFERSLEIETFCRNGRQLVAGDGIDEGGLVALPTLPTTG
jgi:hypothetical protein